MYMVTLSFDRYRRETQCCFSSMLFAFAFADAAKLLGTYVCFTYVPKTRIAQHDNP